MRNGGDGNKALFKATSEEALSSMIHTAKTTVVSRQVAECGRDSRALFRLVNQLFGVKMDSTLPRHDALPPILDTFPEFFSSKIAKLKNFESTWPLESNQPEAAAVKTSPASTSPSLVSIR